MQSQPLQTRELEQPTLPHLLHQRSQPPPSETPDQPTRCLTPPTLHAPPQESIAGSSTSVPTKQMRHEPITEKAQTIQKMTQDHQTRVRERMKNKYDGNKNVVEFSEGDFATLAISGSDRASLDQRRILVKIIKMPKTNCYELQTPHGILERKVTASSLNTIDEDVVRRFKDHFINAPTKKISLHAAALKSSSNVKRVAIACNCRKGCGTHRCVCHKNNHKCTQNCHPEDYDCGNLAERIINGIEKPLIDVNDSADNNRESVEPALTITRRKRVATNSCPQQRKHKQAKRRALPLSLKDTLSATNSLGRGSSRRPSRRREPTFKVREQHK